MESIWKWFSSPQKSAGRFGFASPAQTQCGNSEKGRKIEVFVRHCVFSSISHHKKRFPDFSKQNCHLNLLETIDPKRANVTFFLDTAKGKEHFIKEQSRYPVVEIEAGSEASSFLELLKYVESLRLDPSTIVYFLEDDYLHRPSWVDVLLEGFQIPLADYVTLYDHRDKYFAPSYQKLSSRIFATRSCHWRTTPSTTNTFAMRYETLLRHLSIHRRFSENREISADHEKFCFLGKRGVNLLSSIPGYSTHAEPEFASPCYNWEQKESVCLQKR